MFQRHPGVVSFVLGLLVALPVHAQEEQSDLRAELEALRRGQVELQNQIELMKEVEELKNGQDEIRRELEDIKRLLEDLSRAPARDGAAAPTAPSAPSGPDVEGVVFDVGTNPAMGEVTAKLTLVEFTDYQ